MLYVFSRCKDAFDGADAGQWLESVNVGCRSFLFSKAKSKKQKAGLCSQFQAPSEGKTIRARTATHPHQKRQNTRLALPFVRYLLELKDGVPKGAKVVKKLEEEKSKRKERQSINTNNIVLR